LSQLIGSTKQNKEFQNNTLLAVCSTAQIFSQHTIPQAGGMKQKLKLKIASAGRFKKL
jgi:hypothetical protein